METLKNSRQFERVRRQGRTWACGVMVLNAAPNGLEAVRNGLIAGKKVGGAVQRNRARRRIREALRHRLPLIKQGHDLVWIARAAILDASSADVDREMDQLLARGRLLAPSPPVTAEAKIAYNRVAEGKKAQALPPASIAAQDLPAKSKG